VADGNVRKPDERDRQPQECGFYLDGEGKEAFGGLQFENWFL
jgi:hypothetical protein